MTEKDMDMERAKKRIFVSYAHSDSFICRKICDRLREAGYEILIDTSKIKGGDDWRQKIFDMVRESDKVLASFSKDSIRDPGVCREELRISMAVRHGNIRSVYLEPEEKLNPPSRYTHRQWIDMSDWKKQWEQGQLVFEPWFEQKMRELLRGLDEDKEFAGEIERLRRILEPNESSSRQDALSSRVFCGRQWLRDQIHAWTEQENGGHILVVSGDPGVGKSAFFAHLADEEELVVGALFCERGNDHLNTPESVIRTISYQLACRLPGFRRALLYLLLDGDKKLADQTGSELFDLLIAQPSKLFIDGNGLRDDGTVDGGMETVCFLIDALDECGSPDHNPLAEVLMRYADRMPRWLRFIVSTRRVSSVTSFLGNAPEIALQGGAQENRADVRKYFQETLGDRIGTEKALDELVEATEGIFLYAVFLADEIRRGRSLTETGQYPEGLSGIFADWFAGMYPSQREYEERYQRFLSLLLAGAGRGIPDGMLLPLLEIDENEKNTLLRRTGLLLEEGTDYMGNRTWSFSHQYIAEWLSDKESGRFRCSKEAGERLLGDRLCARAAGGPEGMTDWELLSLDVYLRNRANKSLDPRYLKLREDPRFAERLIALGDEYVSRDQTVCADICYRKAALLAEGDQRGFRRRRDARARKERIRYRSRLLSSAEQEWKAGEGPTSARELVRRSLDSCGADRIEEYLRAEAFEKTYGEVKRQIRRQSGREEAERHGRGLAALLPLLLLAACMLVMYEISFLSYCQGYIAGWAARMAVTELLSVGSRCALAGWISFLILRGKTFHQWFWKLLIGLVGLQILDTVFWTGDILEVLQNALYVLWPLFMMVLASRLSLQAERRFLQKGKYDSILNAGIYYVAVMALCVLGLPDTEHYWASYPFTILYMVLTAAMAYLYFAVPDPDPLIEYSRQQLPASIFDLHSEEVWDEERVLQRHRKRRPARIAMSLILGLELAFLCLLKSRRVRAILLSLYLELRGVEGEANLGWLSWRREAFLGGITGWTLLALALSVLLLFLMRRYMLRAEERSVRSVQSLIFSAFALQTAFTALVKLFGFAGSDVGLPLVETPSSLVLLTIFITAGLGLRRRGKGGAAR